jgi:hypothetical protein
VDARTFRDHALDYCCTFSASETSGFRTVQHNRAVGGVTGGPHIAGLAVDVTYDGARPGPEADRWLLARGLRRFAKADHDHLQPVDWINRLELALQRLPD